MKYDLTKCNNLNFKIKDGTTGYIKTNEAKSMFYIYFDKDKNSCFNASLQINVDALTLVFGTLAEFENGQLEMNLRLFLEIQKHILIGKLEILFNISLLKQYALLQLS